MKPLDRQLLIAISTILSIAIVAAAGLLWIAVEGWPPIIIRDGQYRKLIADFKQAQPRNRAQANEKNIKWDFQVQLSERQTTVGVKAYEFPCVVSVKYADEGVGGGLYEYLDYSHPHEIRTAGDIIYVHWSHGVISDEDWLMAYDLAARREITRREIDPDDLKQSH
jgi:hypothetical protein